MSLASLLPGDNVNLVCNSLYLSLSVLYVLYLIGEYAPLKVRSLGEDRQAAFFLCQMESCQGRR